MHCTNIFNEKHYWPDLHLMTLLDFTGPLDRPLRRELEKVFLTPGASCDQIDPHVLWIFILQAQRKTHTPKCKVSKGMKWVPFLVPGQERFERFETQRGGVWQNCKIASKTFPSLLPPNGTLGHPWSLEILSLWMDHQVCGRRKNVKKVAPVVVRDHCRPSYGHQQSKKVVEFLINSDFEIWTLVTCWSWRAFASTPQASLLLFFQGGHS